MFERVKKLFSGVLSDRFPAETSSSKITSSRRVTNKLVEYVVNLSRFDTMQEEDIYEQLWAWEPEVGGAIDRMSTLVGQSFRGFILKDDTNQEGEKVKANDTLAKKMIEDANKIGENIKVPGLLETYAELTYMHGNTYILVGDRLQLITLPNKYITLVPDIETIGKTDVDVLMEANYLVLNEQSTTTFNVGKKAVTSVAKYPMEKIRHIKYKDTPYFIKDTLGRTTYGLYSISPIQRTILAVWQKRQTSIIDILWRWRNVPREHHSIDSSVFNLANYSGSNADRLKAAKADAEAYMGEYKTMLEAQQPDQGYITLDTISINPALQSKRSTQYMQTNELIKQLDDKIWSALNIPESVVSGKSGGSYASELVVSNYVTEKAIQLADKIKPVILENVRERLKMINSSYPVDRLDMKLELVMATSKLEIFRQAAIMATLDSFTRDEIRDLLEYESLTEEQLDKIITSGRAKTTGDVNRDVGGMDPNVPQPPDTSHSGAQHKQDTADMLKRKESPV